MGVDSELLEMLVCPKCKGSLSERFEGEQNFLDCVACGLGYPVQDGIPVMLVEEAATLAGATQDG